MRLVKTMKKTKKQLVLSTLLAGKSLTTKDIAAMLSETGKKMAAPDVASVLSVMTDRLQSNLSYFIIKDTSVNPYRYNLVPEALNLSEEQLYGLTLKTGGKCYPLDQALKDFPKLKKYAPVHGKAKPVKSSKTAKNVTALRNIYPLL